MFKRLFWLTLGFGSGLGTSWYVIRSVKKTVRRTVAAYAPVELAGRAGEGVRDVRANLRAAMAEGRAAMREREVELKARVEASRRGAVRPAFDAAAGAAVEPVASDARSGADSGAPGAPAGATAATAATDDEASLVLDELAARRNRLAMQAAGRARSGQ